MTKTRDLSALLGQLEDVPGVESAEVLGVGGGCENLHVALADGRLIVATEAFLDGRVWLTEPSVPDTEAGPWYITVQTRDGYENGETGYTLETHADRAEFVRAVEFESITVCPCGGKIVRRVVGTFDGRPLHSRECATCRTWFNTPR